MLNSIGVGGQVPLSSLNTRFSENIGAFEPLLAGHIAMSSATIVFARRKMNAHISAFLAPLIASTLTEMMASKSTAPAALDGS